MVVYLEDTLFDAEGSNSSNKIPYKYNQTFILSMVYDKNYKFHEFVEFVVKKMRPSQALFIQFLFQKRD